MLAAVDVRSDVYADVCSDMEAGRAYKRKFCSGAKAGMFSENRKTRLTHVSTVVLT